MCSPAAGCALALQPVLSACRGRGGPWANLCLHASALQGMACYLGCCVCAILLLVCEADGCAVFIWAVLPFGCVVQSVVRPTKLNANKRRVLKRNPLKNLGALLKLNPHAKAARRASLLLEAKRQKAKAEKTDVKKEKV